MRPQRRSTLFLIVGAAALLSTDGRSVHAQQPDATAFNEGFEQAIAKAEQECTNLWADHVFDPLRDKLPLGPQKPTIEMLINSERLRAEDRPLADLAIKTEERCRAAYAPAYALLPAPVNTMIEGLYREEDALVAQLYTGKITFGEFNVGSNRLAGEIFRALSGIPRSVPSAVPAQEAAPVAAAPAQSASPQPPDQGDKARVALVRDTRLALVIGNGNYLNLPKLSNPTNDAEAIADILGKMGYVTRLVMNASEQDMRHEVRKFAADSERADVALVFYAGHGAQVNGENYLLPTDMDIPHIEADIQFSGLKVDDLVNSLRSTTKIVFLDACRDNPALFKNFTKGRGAHSAGLAPTVASNLEVGKPGGGIFIAYATDSGAVATDGAGKHSPFTQALLRYLQMAISIDDMFSLVTREVRLITDNTQRPYKYASLEGIVCLSGPCPSASGTFSVVLDPVQQAKDAEADELRMALQVNSADALQAYLRKYPDSANRFEVLSKISSLRRAEFTEWTLFEVGNQLFPQFMRLSSIRQSSDRVSVETRFLLDPSLPGRKFPDPSYEEDVVVVACDRPLMATAESTILDQVGKVLYHYKWGDSQFVDLSIGSEIKAGTIGFVTQRILCREEMRTPLVDKAQLSAMSFPSLASTASGDGDVFYAPIHTASNDQNEVIVVAKFHEDHELKLPIGSAPGIPRFRTQVSRVRVNCAEGTMVATKTEYYDASNSLVYFYSYDEDFSVAKPSPLAVLRRIVCKAKEAAK